MINKDIGKIGKKIYKYMVFTAIFSIVTVSILEMFSGYYQHRKFIEKTHEQLLASFSYRSVKSIEDIKTAMKITITSKGILETGLSERFKFYLEKLLHYNPAIFEAVALDEKGNEVAIASKVRLSNDKKFRGDEEFFKEGFSGKTYISKVYLLYETKPFLTIAMPISLYSGKNVGVLAVQVSLFELQKFISHQKIGNSGYAYIADTNGNVIAHPVLSNALGRLNIYNIPSLSNFKKVYENPNLIHHFIYKNTEGVYVLGSATGINELGWIIGVSMPVKDVFSHNINSVFFLITTIVLSIVFIYFLTKMIAKKIAGPILTLLEATENIGAGDIGSTVEIKTADEIEELADKFNIMSTNLKELYSDLERRVDERTKEVEILFSFTSTISKEVSLKNLLSTAGDELSLMLDLDGYVFLYNNSDDIYQFSPVVFKGTHEKQLSNFIMLIQNHNYKNVISHHNIVVLNTLQATHSNLLDDISSVGFFPVIFSGKLLGIFVFFSKRECAFTEEIKSLIDTCMIQLGVNINNAILFEETKQLSLTDTLTGLPNRRYFETKIDYEFSRFKRYERPFSLLMIDIDHFKKVNDTYGHASGDIVLKTLGTIIANFIRKSDFAARLGGEEFVILLPETTKESACIAAERLKKKVEETVFKIDTPPYELKCTISIGSSDAKTTMERWQELVENADNALYMAKESGRNKVCYL